MDCLVTTFTQSLVINATLKMRAQYSLQKASFTLGSAAGKQLTNGFIAAFAALAPSAKKITADNFKALSVADWKCYGSSCTSGTGAAAFPVDELTAALELRGVEPALAAAFRTALGGTGVAQLASSINAARAANDGGMQVSSAGLVVGAVATTAAFRVSSAADSASALAS